MVIRKELKLTEELVLDSLNLAVTRSRILKIDRK